MEGGVSPLCREAVSVFYSSSPSWGNHGVHVFPKGISPNVNVIARLKFEHAYMDVAVQHVNHNITGTTLLCAGISNLSFRSLISR